MAQNEVPVDFIAVNLSLYGNFYVAIATVGKRKIFLKAVTNNLEAVRKISGQTRDSE